MTTNNHKFYFITPYSMLIPTSALYGVAFESRPVAEYKLHYDPDSSSPEIMVQDFSGKHYIAHLSVNNDSIIETKTADEDEDDGIPKAVFDPDADIVYLPISMTVELSYDSIEEVQNDGSITTVPAMTRMVDHPVLKDILEVAKADDATDEEIQFAEDLERQYSAYATAFTKYHDVLRAIKDSTLTLDAQNIHPSLRSTLSELDQKHSSSSVSTLERQRDQYRAKIDDIVAWFNDEVFTIEPGEFYRAELTPEEARKLFTSLFSEYVVPM